MKTPTRMLRRAFEELGEGVVEIDALLFTTFGFSVEFFEDCVIGPLAVDQTKLSSAQEVFGASEFCDEANVAVFYDANATKATDKRVTFDTFPVFPEQGVFHPKIILLSGRTDDERVVRLLVGSANLGLAGWAKNREIFTVVDIIDEATAEPLSALLDCLFASQRDRAAELHDRYGHVQERLEALAGRPATETSPRLHVSIPGQTTSLMRYLIDQQAEALTCYSPYFGSEPLEFLGQICPEGRVTVVAAQDEDGRLPLPAEQVEALSAADFDAEGAAKNVALARIPDPDDDEEYRFDHFKAYGWWGRTIIGSHNATQAALGRPDGTGHRNVEVSVELPGATSPEAVEFSERPVGTPKEDLEMPEDVAARAVPASIEVTADWKEGVYVIELGEAMPDCVIDLPGLSRGLRLDEATKAIPFSERSRVELLEQKWFEVLRRTSRSDSTTEPVYRGLINERHWRTYRREAVLDSLTACFDAWVSGTVDDPTAQDDHLVSASEKLLADSEGRAQPLHAGPLDDDVFENYFRFFRASQGYWERLDRVIEADDATRCVRLLVSAPGSLQRVLELTETHVEEDGEDFWSVYRFVLVHEMRRLLNRVRDSACHLEEVSEVVERLEPAVIRLVEVFEEHPAWQRVEASGELKESARFVLEEMGYRDD